MSDVLYARLPFKQIHVTLVCQGISKVTTAVFRSRESENSHQVSGLYPNTRMAEERFNVDILRISEIPSGPGIRTIENPIKDTYHTSVLFTVKP